MEQRADFSRSQDNQRQTQIGRPSRELSTRLGTRADSPSQPDPQRSHGMELAGHQAPLVAVLRRALSSHQALRHAMVLQEILGPPKALLPPGAGLIAPANGRPLG
jgi:hypothetical protein